MKYLFFLTGAALLMASVAGCVATDGAPSTVPTKVMDSHPQADVSLSEGHSASKLDCPKSRGSAKDPSLGKINANLLCAETKAKATGASFTNMAARMGIVTIKGGVVLDIVTSRLDADVERKLRLPGVTIRYLSVKYRRVSVVIRDPSSLYQLARIPEVRTIMPEYGGRTRGSNVGVGMRVKPKSYK